MSMEKRPLGDTGFNITALSYGAMELRKMEEGAASRLLNAVLDQGINYIDTSPDYGPSEAMIGKAIAHRRDEYVLATKCGCNVDAAGQHLEPRHIYSRAQLMKNVENSLRLLRTDHLDVWQVHTIMPEDLPGAALDDVLGAMSDLQRQGKVRAIGCTYKTGKIHDGDLYPAGFSVTAMKHFLSCDAFRVMQPVYGALARGCEDLIAEAAGRGVGVVARGSFPRLPGQPGENPRRLGTGRTARAGRPGDVPDPFRPEPSRGGDHARGDQELGASRGQYRRCRPRPAIGGGLPGGQKASRRDRDQGGRSVTPYRSPFGEVRP